jgi:hypothetical protein
MEGFKEMFDKLSGEEKELFLKNRYGYIFGKAKLLLKMGANEYLLKKKFEIDTSNLNDEDYKILMNGCEQVVIGRGLSAEKPFENLGVLGFSKLFEIFHFNTVRIKTLKPEPLKFLDLMCLEHVVDGYKAEYYNLIEY